MRDADELSRILTSLNRLITAADLLKTFLKQGPWLSFFFFLALGFQLLLHPPRLGKNSVSKITTNEQTLLRPSEHQPSTQARMQSPTPIFPSVQGPCAAGGLSGGPEKQVPPLPPRQGFISANCAPSQGRSWPVSGITYSVTLC